MNRSQTSGPARSRSTVHRWGRTLYRFAGRPIADQAALVQALVVVLIAWMALRGVSFRRLLRTRTSGDSAVAWNASHERICWAVQVVAGRLFPQRPCLVQALAAQWLLHPRGVYPDLHLGVLKDGETLHAHAWLTVLDPSTSKETVVVGGRASPDVFQPFPSLAQARSAASKAANRTTQANSTRETTGSDAERRSEIHSLR